MEEHPHIKKPAPKDLVKRSAAKALSWRLIGTLDTVVLSWLVITYIGPVFEGDGNPADALQAATYIALTEVITKMALYFLHERGWARVVWGVSTKNDKHEESGSRSTIKTATWRIIASLDTTFLAWIFTGDFATAVSIGGLEVITKLVLYFFHERVWSRVQFGIKK
ncbi:MAG: putative membrane protein [Paracoccaceae bacterium]|jgi:uncharacterized membrane protein